jgi:hypothetical protein
MAKNRTIRRGFVEYQPNLQIPVAPVPLGIFLEEWCDNSREVVIVGRAPIRSGATVNIDHLWGAFRTEITDWIQILDRRVTTSFSEVAEDVYVVDYLAQCWRSNLYIREPESIEVKGRFVPLMQYATRWYEQYVGEPFQRHEAKPKGARRKPKAQNGSWRKRALSMPEVGTGLSA